MPKIDITAVPGHTGSGYPPQFAAPCYGIARGRMCGISERHRQWPSPDQQIFRDGRFVHKDGTPYPMS